MVHLLHAPPLPGLRDIPPSISILNAHSLDDPPQVPRYIQKPLLVALCPCTNENVPPFPHQPCYLAERLDCFEVRELYYDKYTTLA